MTAADGSQEVDRALDNLVKSGKFYPAPPRRDQMPPMYAMPGMCPSTKTVSASD